MLNKLSKIWKYVAGGSSVLAYQAFYERYQNINNTIEFTNVIQNLREDISKIDEKISNCNDPELIKNLQILVKELKLSLYKIENNHISFVEKMKPIKEGGIQNESSLKAFDDYKEQFKATFQNAKEQVEKIEKSLENKDKFDKFLDDNIIMNSINDFKEYLSNLSMTEICLVINISSSIFILTCLVSIILSVYGNFILNKFSLESKYPKLAFFIKLRIKLQHSYVIINTIFILIALIGMIIVNFITLTNF